MALQIISPDPLQALATGAVRAMDPASVMALPDEVLVLVLANVDHASCHRLRATCRTFRDLNEHASAVRVRALTFPQDCKVKRVQRALTDWHRFDNDDGAPFWTPMRLPREAYMRWHFPRPPRGHKWADMYLEGTGDDFVISTTDIQGIKLFLRADSAQTTLLSCSLDQYRFGPALTENRREASRWTAVETLSYQGRVYAARPDCGFIKLKNSPRFLEGHGSNGMVGLFNIGELTGNLDGHPQLENHEGPQLCAVDFRLRGTRMKTKKWTAFENLPPTPYPYSSYVGRLRRG